MSSYLYENMWREVLENAGSYGKGMRINVDGEQLTTEHITEIYDWILHNRGSDALSNYTMVYPGHLGDRIKEIAGDGYYWTGDSGRFDNGDVFSLDRCSPVRARTDDAMLDHTVMIVDLDYVRLNGDVTTYRRGVEDSVEIHPFGAIYGVTP